MATRKNITEMEFQDIKLKKLFGSTLGKPPTNGGF
jgi:hypothetical protein